MRQEREMSETRPSAYINSAFKGFLILTAIVALLKWGMPTATKAGIGLTDKIGETFVR